MPVAGKVTEGTGKPIKRAGNDQRTVAPYSVPGPVHDLGAQLVFGDFVGEAGAPAIFLAIQRERCIRPREAAAPPVGTDRSVMRS